MFFLFVFLTDKHICLSMKVVTIQDTKYFVPRLFIFSISNLPVQQFGLKSRIFVSYNIVNLQFLRMRKQWCQLRTKTQRQIRSFNHFEI